MEDLSEELSEEELGLIDTIKDTPNISFEHLWKNCKSFYNKDDLGRSLKRLVLLGYIKKQYNTYWPAEREVSEPTPEEDTETINDLNEKLVESKEITPHKEKTIEPSVPLVEGSNAVDSSEEIGIKKFGPFRRSSLSGKMAYILYHYRTRYLTFEEIAAKGELDYKKCGPLMYSCAKAQPRLIKTSKVDGIRKYAWENDTYPFADFRLEDKLIVSPRNHALIKHTIDSAPVPQQPEETSSFHIMTQAKFAPNESEAEDQALIDEQEIKVKESDYSPKMQILKSSTPMLVYKDPSNSPIGVVLANLAAMLPGKGMLTDTKKQLFLNTVSNVLDLYYED